MQDTLHEAACLAANGVKQLQEDNRNLSQRLSELERHFDAATAEISILSHRLTEAQRTADFYMRYSVEISTQLNCIQAIISEAMTRARDHAYKPSLAAPETSEPIAEEAIPGFLTKQRQVVNG